MVSCSRLRRHTPSRHPSPGSSRSNLPCTNRLPHPSLLRDQAPHRNRRGPSPQNLCYLHRTKGPHLCCPSTSCLCCPSCIRCTSCICCPNLRWIRIRCPCLRCPIRRIRSTRLRSSCRCC